MEEPIFKDAEIAGLKRRKPIAPVEQFLEEEERIAGLEQAIARIKADYKTHRVLLDRIQEPNGLVLDLSGFGFHFKEGESFTDSENGSAPYFNIRFPEPFSTRIHPYLIIKRNKNNLLVLGNPFFQDYRRGESTESVLGICVPQERRINPSEADNNPINSLEEVTRKLLVERAVLCNAVRNPEEFDKNRKYYEYRVVGNVDKFRIVTNPLECVEEKGSCTPYHLLTDLTAEDFLRFYKHAVKQCARELERIENIETRRYSSNHYNRLKFRALTQDFSKTKNQVTKLAGFSEIPMDLSVLD